jgi:hypothetical protein
LSSLTSLERSSTTCPSLDTETFSLVTTLDLTLSDVSSLTGALRMPARISSSFSRSHGGVTPAHTHHIAYIQGGGGRGRTESELICAERTIRTGLA